MAGKYVFWGGYAGNNLGDEAILWALSRLIRKLDPAAEQFVFIPDGVSAAVEAQYKEWNIAVVSGPLLRCLGIFRHARLIVGGGQMIDDSSYAWPIGWSSIFIAVNKLWSHRPLVLCVGAEPLRKTIPRFLVRHFYGLAEVITCRDEESSTVVREAGVPAAKVWTTRDVVFSLDRSQLPQWEPGRSTVRTVAVAVAYDPARVLEDVSRYKHLVIALRKLDFRVEFLAHDLREAYDVQALREVKKSFLDDEGVQVAHASNVAETFDIYARVDAVISARMHPLIMGMLAGTLPIAYGGKAKVRSLLSNSAIPAIAADGEPRELATQLDDVFAQRDSIRRQLAETAETYRYMVEEATSLALQHGRR
ncbi:polysaccharide pyruvyl transferase family protein [Granulicella sp. L60]|uniref:polysaccharide pyruvyl transferase family protein n=1 Tax=Granulicella sp. L60 TaxID=1641866 RepID=UPI00131C61D9|nr:polysaccharide pyruvyl transferase family protein [Granulicella sp. L60]